MSDMIDSLDLYGDIDSNKPSDAKKPSQSVSDMLNRANDHVMDIHNQRSSVKYEAPPPMPPQNMPVIQTQQNMIHPMAMENRDGLKVFDHNNSVVIVAGLAWWITETDLIQALSGYNILGVQEIKFHENKTNGQSKGFATVTFSSPEHALSLLKISSLPDKPIFIKSITPNIVPFSRNAMSEFEMQSRKDCIGRSRSNRQNSYGSEHGNTGNNWKNNVYNQQNQMMRPPMPFNQMNHMMAAASQFGFNPMMMQQTMNPKSNVHVNPAFFDDRDRRNNKRDDRGYKDRRGEESTSRYKYLVDNCIKKAYELVDRFDVSEALECIVQALGTLRATNGSSSRGQVRDLIEKLQDEYYSIESKYKKDKRSRSRSRDRGRESTRESNRDKDRDNRPKRRSRGSNDGTYDRNDRYRSSSRGSNDYRSYRR